MTEGQDLQRPGKTLTQITNLRNALAAKMKVLLEGAEFRGSRWMTVWSASW